MKLFSKKSVTEVCDRRDVSHFLRVCLFGINIYKFYYDWIF